MQRIHDGRASMPALVAIAIAAATGCGSPAGRPAQTAPRKATGAHAGTTMRGADRPRVFLSRRYGFRVTLTTGWSGVDASVDWNGKTLQGLDSAAFANFTERATGRTLVAASAAVAKGMGLAEWGAAMVRAAPAFCSNSSSVEQTTIGAEPALAWSATCSDGYHVRKLATLHGARGDMIFLASPAKDGDAANQRVFDAIRRSFRFTR